MPEVFISERPRAVYQVNAPDAVFDAELFGQYRCYGPQGTPTCHFTCSVATHLLDHLRSGAHAIPDKKYIDRLRQMAVVEAQADPFEELR